MMTHLGIQNAGQHHNLTTFIRFFYNLNTKNGLIKYISAIYVIYTPPLTLY